MFAILSAGLAPTIALMTFFYLKDRYREPLPLIIKMFVWGVLIVFPIMFMQYTLAQEGWIQNDIFHSYMEVGLLEEFFKWFVFVFMIYHHTAFDTHYDGIVYAVAISLGFATLENILYLMTNGVEFALSRAIFPVSSHALFGVIMGFYFGKAKMNAQGKTLHIALALVLPFLLHGTYNYILSALISNWIYLLIPFMLGLWLIAMRRVRVASAPTIQQPVTPISKYNKRA